MSDSPDPYCAAAVCVFDFDLSQTCPPRCDWEGVPVSLLARVRVAQDFVLFFIATVALSGNAGRISGDGVLHFPTNGGTESAIGDGARCGPEVCRASTSAKGKRG